MKKQLPLEQRGDKVTIIHRFWELKTPGRCTLSVYTESKLGGIMLLEDMISLIDAKIDVVLAA